MAKSAGDPLQFVSRLSLVGRSTGAVKSLSGFSRKHHTVPEAVNATTTAFLGKLCARELAAEGEAFFQRTRSALDYRRAELSLTVTSPAALLTSKDFVLEIAYALEKTDPARYSVERTLHGLSRGDLVASPAFDALFAGTFSGIVFGLTKGVAVEAVVDAVEAGGSEGKLTVSYPSDCRHCLLQVEGIDADVLCDGATLEMRFPRHGSPRELIADFVAVRSAFALARNRVLAGLL